MDGRFDEQKLAVSIHMYLLVMHGKRGQGRKGPEKKKRPSENGEHCFCFARRKKGRNFFSFYK